MRSDLLRRPSQAALVSPVQGARFAERRHAVQQAVMPKAARVQSACVVLPIPDLTNDPTVREACLGLGVEASETTS